MISSVKEIARIQTDLVKLIRAKEFAYEIGRKKIREKWPEDAYGTKWMLKTNELDARYLPLIKALKWYSFALSDLVEMKEGGNGKE